MKRTNTLLPDTTHFRAADRLQGRIDRSEACLVEVAERAFLEGLLDLVAAGGAARQHAEAKGLCIHVARSAGSGGFRTPFYIYRLVKLGLGSFMERVCQSVYISLVARILKKKLCTCIFL